MPVVREEDEQVLKGMLELGEICMRRLPQYLPELGQGSRTVEIKEEFPGEVTITANKKGLDRLLGPEPPKKDKDGGV